MSNRHVRKAKEEVRYFMRKGGGIGGVSPNVVGETLTAIHAKHGGLNAKTVVDESRPDDAPLHPVFEWKDRVAGELYRQHQARNLIKRVLVEQTDDTGKPERVPVFVHVPNETARNKQGDYHPVTVVVQQPGMYLAALTQLLRKVSEATKSVEEVKRAAKAALASLH